MSDEQIPETQTVIVGDDLSPEAIMRQTVPAELLAKLNARAN